MGFMRAVLLANTSALTRRVSLRAFAKAHGLAYETWRREYGRGRTAADVPDPRNRRRRIYGEYDPFRAQDDVNDNAKGPRMLVTNVLERRFSHYVKEMLLSPYDAVQRLKADFPGRRIPGTSTWYHHIWRGDISVKYGETPYHPGRRRKPGPKPHPARTVPGHLQLRDRPFEAEWRMEPGHYEIDTVVSRLGGTGGLLVLVDRATRVYHVEKIGRVDQDSVVAAIRRMKRRGLLKDVKSVTSDNGSELNDDEKLSAALGCDVYYTRAYASYEKGSVALYHQSSYQLGDFTFAGGVRLDYEHASLKYHSETHTGYTITSQATGEVFSHENIDINERGRISKEFLQLLPKVSLTYLVGGNKTSSLYLSVAKGSKSGGFNTQMFSDVLQQKLMGFMGIGASYNIDEVVGYKPETAWNYELGGHFECWNHRVKTDISAFYLDCRDRQLTVFPNGTTTGRVMTNAGKTRSIGAEFAIAVNPWRGTNFNVSYGYTNAKFVKYNDGKADYKDKYVPYSPSHTLFVEALHQFDFNSGSQWVRSLTIGANMRGTGEIYWNEANDVRQPFYCLLGASATLAGDKYSLELWGKNITGTKYNSFYFVSIGHTFLQRGRGASMGATLRVNI